MDTTHILKIQTELAQRTLAHPHERHKRLYRLVSDAAWLRVGLDTVLANAGSSTPGIDRVTKSRIDAKAAGREELVQQLATELRTGTYHPQPVKRIYIPKPNGKQRPLGIPTLRDRAVQATVKMMLEPIYESVFYPFSWGFRPLRSTHHALSGLRRGVSDPRMGFKWVLEGDIAACFDEIDHRLLRTCLKKRIHDPTLLDLSTSMLRSGIWQDGRVTYPSCGTPQGGVCSPLLATIFLHEFDDWYHRTYRLQPGWEHLAPSSLQYRRKKEIGGTLMLTRYADDWVAVWNGSRTRAEEIKAEIKTFLGEQLQLRLSEEKTLLTHVDDGLDFLGYRMQGDKRWSDGRWCFFSRVATKALRRFRDAVEAITRHTFTDEVATFTALAGLIRGWGNYYAYAAESRLMDSLDGFIYQRIWSYCLRKNREAGAKAVYRKYTLPPEKRAVGFFQIGVVVGAETVRIPRLSSIPRKALRLAYPEHPYLVEQRALTLVKAGLTDEQWWDQHVWAGQEGRRTGQRRFALEVKAREAICQVCGTALTSEAHHVPPWNETRKHDPRTGQGVCFACHRRILHGAEG